MASGADLERLRDTYKIWNDTKGEGDRPRNAWLELFDDQIQITSMGDASRGLSFAKPRHSRRDAVEFFLELLEEWKMEHWSPETFVHQGDHIAMFGRCAWTHRGTNKSMECRIAHLWTFKDGKATDVIEVFDSALAAAAATP